MFSESALMRYRLQVELRWVQALFATPLLVRMEGNVAEQANAVFDAILENFSIEDAMAIKEIERTTNHDVKAVEYFLKKKVRSFPLDFVEFLLISVRLFYFIFGGFI